MEKCAQIRSGFPCGSQCRVCLQCGRTRFSSWVGKIPWWRKWQSTPVLPGKSHGWRNLAGYSLWGGKELDTTEGLTLSLSHTHTQSQKQTRKATGTCSDINLCQSIILCQRGWNFFFKFIYKIFQKRKQTKKAYCDKKQINDCLGDRVRGTPATRFWRNFYRKWK